MVPRRIFGFRLNRPLVPVRGCLVAVAVGRAWLDGSRCTSPLLFGLGGFALQLCLITVGVLVVAVTAVAIAAYALGRRRLEKDRRASEQQFRCLFQNCSDAILLLDENRFFDCNEAALGIFGLEEYEQLLQWHPADLSPPRQPDGSDSKRLAAEKIAKALAEGNHRFEWVHRRADGTDFPTEVSLNAVRIDHRRVLQVVIRDVTYRKKSEEQLRWQEEKLRTISRAALDAVIMMDGQGRAVHWNPAAEKMFGYTAEEALGQEIHRLVTPARHRQLASGALSSYFETGKGPVVGRMIELQAVRKGGEEFPIEASLAPIHMQGEWWAVAVVRDITDRKLADEQLQAEQRTLRRLLKAHDQEHKLIAYDIHDGLAQQLVAAIMRCQAGAAEQPGSERMSDVLELLRQCLAETRRVISGLRPPSLDESGVISAVEGLVAESREEEGPEIEFQHEGFRERLEPVLENSIYRIIQESLRNACRHSQSRRILIWLAQTESRIDIHVQDWGKGFDPERVPPSRYGLAGIRERARLWGGQATIDSVPGKGTTIAVQLPTEVKDFAE